MSKNETIGIFFIICVLMAIAAAWFIYFKPAKETAEPVESESRKMLREYSAPESETSVHYTSDEEFIEKFSAPESAILKYTNDEEFVEKFSAPASAEPKYIK